MYIGSKLVEDDKYKDFCENSDFRFFKNEIPDVTSKLINFKEDEKSDFYNFAYALGCFSSDKILDEEGRKTEEIVAQKASSNLVKILKNEIKLRRISQFICFTSIISKTKPGIFKIYC